MRTPKPALHKVVTVQCFSCTCNPCPKGIAMQSSVALTVLQPTKASQDYSMTSFVLVAVCSMTQGVYANLPTTDTARFPTGSRRDGPGFAGVAYITPTGPGKSRQFHTFLKTTPKGPSPSAPLTQPQRQGGASSSNGGVASSSSSNSLNTVATTTNSKMSSSSNGRKAEATASGASAAGGSSSSGTQAKAPAQSSAGGSSSVRRPARSWRMVLAGLVPTPRWLGHLMSSFLVDADVAIQWGCGLNR